MRLVYARIDDDREQLIDLLDELITGPRGDSLNVTLVLAGILAEDVTEQEDGFHRVTVRVVDKATGTEREGSTTEVPPHVAIFAQMVVAIANQDVRMAKDLFIGYVGDDDESYSRALRLIVFGLNEAAHDPEVCPWCSQRPEEATV